MLRTATCVAILVATFTTSRGHKASTAFYTEKLTHISRKTAVGNEDLLIGWKGETFRKVLAKQPGVNLSQVSASQTLYTTSSRATSALTATVASIARSSSSSATASISSSLLRGAPMGSNIPEDRTSWIETVSWEPRTFIHHNLLTITECDHLISIGKNRVHKSMVVNATTGQTQYDKIRTSYGASFTLGEDPIIATIEEKIAEWTHLPPEYGEQIQILRYENGQEYDAHWDWFGKEPSQKAYIGDGDRYATVLMYLSELQEGGETTLPLAVPIDEKSQHIENPSPCAAKGGIAVRPKKGDVLLFFDMDIAGQEGNRLSLHAACPALKGTKWTATKWIHNRPYGGGKFDALAVASICVDKDRDCQDKAAAGECELHADVLGGLEGRCRLSCGDCVKCPPHDIICMRRNMQGNPERKRSSHI